MWKANQNILGCGQLDVKLIENDMEQAVSPSLSFSLFLFLFLSSASIFSVVFFIVETRNLCILIRWELKYVKLERIKTISIVYTLWSFYLLLFDGCFYAVKSD